MQDIYADILPWIKAGSRFALATVTRTWGSAPRREGSAMAVREDLMVAGSVSGGCIEGAVIDAARQVLTTGEVQHLSFGVSNEKAWSVGLTCGGEVTVFIEPFIAFSSDRRELQAWQSLKAALDQSRPAILITRLSPEAYGHDLILPGAPEDAGKLLPDREVCELALESYHRRRSGLLEIEARQLFAQVIPARDRMIIIGAAHISVPLVRFAVEIGFEVTVIDPRRIFATADRFPVPPHVLKTEWPQDVLPAMKIGEDTYGVLLTHDPRIDDPALHHLLKSDVRYIGALGSRKTHEKRCERLREAGFSDQQIGRIRGPAGLDIEAVTPEEIALSIIAEVIQAKRSRG